MITKDYKEKQVEISFLISPSPKMGHHFSLVRERGLYLSAFKDILYPISNLDFLDLWIQEILYPNTSPCFCSISLPGLATDSVFSFAWRMLAY